MNNGNHGERIARLEAEIRRLALDVGKYQAREAVASGRVMTRLAKVSNTPSAGDSVFEIIFRDGEFTETAGDQTVDWTDRQETSEAVCAGIFDDELPDHNEMISVFRWSNRWWTAYRKSSSLILVTADADIEHNATGTCSVVGDTTDYQVFNGRDKLWQGAETLIGWNKTSARWQVVQAWSATFIRGTVTGSTIAAGATGSLGSVVAENGHFAPTTVSNVLNPNASGSTLVATVGKRAWAKLVWTGTASQWQIYGVDCG